MKNLLLLITARQTSILSGAAVLMVTVAVSKVLGLVRDRLLVHFFAPGDLATFLAAFRLPDLLFQLLIFGAVSVAFIPVFTEYLQKRGDKEAFKFAAEVLNMVMIGFSIVCLIALILARPLTELVVPGFTASQKELTAQLTQVILLGQIILAIGALFAGIAQSYQRFIVPALAAASYNIGIILGIIFLVPTLGIFGPALGVVIGAFLHVAIQLPLVGNLGFKYSLRLSLVSSGIREVLGMMSIRTLGVAAEQINETVGVVLSSLISSASITFLTFAQHLYVVPIGLFGATLAQAALPILSREKSRGEMELFKSTLLTTMHQILFLTLPAAAILIVLRIPAVRLVFGASQFTWEATVLTGKTLALFALGLTAQATVLLLIRGFYALKDVKTPVVISVLTVAINIVLSVFFVQILALEVWSLGLSYAIVSNLSLFLLLYFLGQRVGGFNFQGLVIPAVKMVMAAVVSAVALYIPIKALDQLVFDTTRTINLIFLTGIASVFGLSVYLLLVWLMRVKELGTFGNLIKKAYKMEFKVESGEVIKEAGIV